eukprot:TRINITY_DN446_c0_g2_i3.p1 TRINITY_DN446_c0_g2~~TRINITY_DN446_c0_g2_i3.p1  ORF type:complete len:186 (+),score=21.33 TRINITY_DN446_c0_g2_i3:215-772(+)
MAPSFPIPTPARPGFSPFVYSPFSPRSPFAFNPNFTAPKPEPDSCSDKLQYLKECMDKKVDFVLLGLTHYSYDIERSVPENDTQLDDIQSSLPENNTQLESVSVCGESQTESEDFPDHNTIIKVFDYLCEEIMQTNSVNVTYDDTYHFPAYISVDQIEQPIDDENSTYSYSITNFEVLTPDNCTI